LPIWSYFHTVEISLKIPARATRERQQNPSTITNNDVRFIKHVELEAIPLAGDLLTVTVAAGAPLSAM